MLNAIAFLGIPLFVAVAYFNSDSGPRVLGAIVGVVVCFLIAGATSTPQKNYGSHCRSYSIFASEC